MTDLFYGTDYQSHMGTRRAGMATLKDDGDFARSIHNLESSYFRTKFEEELPKFTGKSGIGIISDTDAQPIVLKTKIGKFAIVSVAKFLNQDAMEKEVMEKGGHLSELSSGKTNPTELIGLMISQGKII